MSKAITTLTVAEYSREAASFLTPHARSESYHWSAMLSEVIELIIAIRQCGSANIVKESGDCLFFILAPSADTLTANWPKVHISDGMWGCPADPLPRIPYHTAQNNLLEVADVLATSLAKSIREPWSAEQRRNVMVGVLPTLITNLRRVLAEEGVSLRDAADANLVKLRKRKADNAITGDGNDR